MDFLLRPDRGIAAAQAFFRKALSMSLPRWPRKITLDGHVPSHLALRLLRREDPKWKYVEVRRNQYLNNLIEQDHRAIKRRCAAMVGGFKSFASAAITLAGIGLAHRIRKRQFSFGRGRYQNYGSLKQIWESGIEHSRSIAWASLECAGGTRILIRNPISSAFSAPVSSGALFHVHCR